MPWNTQADSRSSWRETVREIERAWLVPTLLPFEQRLDASGWLPDEVTDYCDRCGQPVGLHEMPDRTPVSDVGDAVAIADPEFGCLSCAGRRLPWRALVRLGDYDGVLREWIHAAKFHRDRAAAAALGRMLARSACQAGFDGPTDATGRLIIPMPMTRRRRLVRGIDHALALARGVRRGLVESGHSAERTRIARVLGRRHRPSQRSRAPSSRPGNVRGSMRVRRGALASVSGAEVLLIDDVATTLSTLLEATRALREAGASSVWAAVAAVTRDPGRRRVGKTA